MVLDCLTVLKPLRSPAFQAAVRLESPMSLGSAFAGTSRSTADTRLPSKAGGACREGAPLHVGRGHAQHAHAL